MSNPRCFFDISLEGELLGRVIFELFADAVPKTAENFRALCTGSAGVNEMGVPLYYKGTPFHRIIAGFMVQGGDFTLRNGKGGQSIYGATFEDEDLRREIDSEGLLVMANRGKNTNGSQFFVSLRPCPHLLGKHVVFGRVVKGYEVIEAISKLPVNEKDHPLQLVTISHCGQLERKAPVKKARTPTPSPSPISDRSRSSRSRFRSISRSRSASPEPKKRNRSRSRSHSRTPSRSRSRSPSPRRRHSKRSSRHHRSSKVARDSHKRRARSPSSSPELSPEQIEALKAQALKEEEDERMKKEARLRQLKELKMRVEKEAQRGQTRRGDGRGMGDWRDEPLGNGEGSRNGGVLYKGRGRMSAPSEGSRRSTGMLGWDD